MVWRDGVKGINRRPGKAAAPLLLALAVLAVSSSLSAAAPETPQGGNANAAAMKRIEELEDRIRRDPNDIEATFEKANLLSAAGMTDEAKALYEELIDRFPNLPEPYNNLAALYAAEGNLVEARNVLETVTASHPELAVVHENLGDIYAALAAGQFRKMEELGAASDSSRRKLELLLKAVEFITPAPKAPRKDGQAQEPPQVLAVVPFDTTPLEDDIKMVLQNWAKIWSKREADRFLTFYGGEFTGSGEAAPDQWREDVGEKMREAEWIKADVSEIEVEILSQKKAAASFTLTYSSSREAEKRERKNLTLEMVGGRWVIVADQALPAAEKTVEPAAEEARPAEKPAGEAQAGEERDLDEAAREEAKNATIEWLEAWRAKDFERYVSSYTWDFTPTGRGRNSWLDSTKKIFESESVIDVQVENLEIHGSGDKAAVTFTQKYTGNGRTDTSTRTLFLVKTEQGWKIKSEDLPPPR